VKDSQEGIHFILHLKEKKDKFPSRGPSIRRSSRETAWYMHKDSTGGRGQISKDLRRSSGRAALLRALAELRVEEVTQEKKDSKGRGL
jgi:hypothetical protein